MSKVVICAKTVATADADKGVEMENRTFDLNTEIFENFEVFEKMYNNYLKFKKSEDDELFYCSEYSCSGNCPFSRSFFNYDRLELKGHSWCRGAKIHYDEYKRYEKFLNPYPSLEELMKLDVHTDRIQYANGGVKENALGGKPKTMFQLLDPEFIEGMADILTMGALKYSPDNWKKVDRIEYERATYHHWNEYLKGNKLDDESGKSHLYHLACNVMFLNWFDRNQVEEEKCVSLH